VFDYVVIGAGSAGCVLASRLTENPATNVLLVEAGPPDRKREIHIPAAFAKLFKTDVDWNFSTEPQDFLNGRRLYWPRGKMLGGSSSMNAMVYIRGRRSDFDSWAAAGNIGWGFPDVIPLFQAAERQLSITELRCVNPLTRAFLDACEQCGIAANSDFNGTFNGTHNGTTQEGAGLYRVTQKNGARCSAADAYLKPALGRGNLTVWTGIHVTRILLENRRAVGIEYLQNGVMHQVRAAKEIVLSAGAIGSPHLLLLSGIGPRHELESFGIAVAAELDGVGENLQDHLAVIMPYSCTQPISLAGAQTIPNLLRYLAGKGGPLTSNVAEAGAFVKSTRGLSEVDVQFHFAPVYYVDHGFTSPGAPDASNPGVSKPGLSKHGLSKHGLSKHGFSLGPALLNPRSRGRLGLRSSDPMQPPAIEPAYLSDPSDLAPLVEGVKLARRIVQSKTFDPYRGEPYFKEDDVEEYVRLHAETLYHPVGTCKMGTDALSVVNARLEVHGIAGLRVADASIMPAIVSGNTNAATIMIGEKAARLIREQ
jgi:choline dehydrogenase